MTQHKAFIALGSNLGKPMDNILSALKALNNDSRWQLLAYSSLYGSKPMGPQDQPDYVNAVCSVSTSLPAAELLQALHDIEDAFGRKRVRHWGERTLDLDLLLFDEQQHQSDSLRVPHPGLYERSFVLYPLVEIAADKLLPNGNTAKQQTETLTEEGLDVLICRSDITI